MMFWAYLLHCRGGRFYAGHTDDLERRIAQHKTGFFPGFTRDFAPVELVWSNEFPTREQAQDAERRIKGWSRKKKLALIRGDWNAISAYAKNKSSPSTSSGWSGVGISQTVFETILECASKEAPHECCGLLLGAGSTIEQAIPTANVSLTPRTHFEIDAQALIDAHRSARAGGLQVLGYYHSHPSGRSAPSATDQAQASGDGRVWAIAGVDGIAFWRDDECGFTSLSYIVTDR